VNDYPKQGMDRIRELIVALINTVCGWLVFYGAGLRQNRFDFLFSADPADFYIVYLAGWSSCALWQVTPLSITVLATIRRRALD
jgi:hypothetical protein